jgi:anti-anti-sigma regulatory factor
MVEWQRVRMLFKTPLSDVAVMLTTFFLTVLVNITVAIEVGLILAALLFMKRMSDLYRVEQHESGGKGTYSDFKHPDISIYTIHGPLFFGAASRIDQSLGETVGGHKKIKLLRLKHVPVIDATGLNILEATVRRQKKRRGLVLFSGVRPNVMKHIREAGLEEVIGAEHFFSTSRQALAHAIKYSGEQQGRLEAEIEAELARFNLLGLDDGESATDALLQDVDPLEEALDSIGVRRIGALGSETVRETVRQTRRIGRAVTDGATTVGKAAARTVKKTRKFVEKPIEKAHRKRRKD